MPAPFFEVTMEKTDYSRLMEEQIASLSGRPELLLHSCCAPCTSSVLERLYPHFRVILYYYNPNTHPGEEYKKRGAELPKLLKAAGMTDVEIIFGEYDPDIFFRCHKSYIINLRRIRNITPYGRWTYIVKLKGLKDDALITHERFEALQKRFM